MTVGFWSALSKMGLPSLVKLFSSLGRRIISSVGKFNIFIGQSKKTNGTKPNSRYGTYLTILLYFENGFTFAKYPTSI